VLAARAARLVGRGARIGYIRPEGGGTDAGAFARAVRRCRRCCHYRADWAGKAGLALLMTLSVADSGGFVTAHWHSFTRMAMR
jgi:hypothetical protein